MDSRGTFSHPCIPALSDRFFMQHFSATCRNLKLNLFLAWLRFFAWADFPMNHIYAFFVFFSFIVIILTLLGFTNSVKHLNILVIIKHF